MGREPFAFPTPYLARDLRVTTKHLNRTEEKLHLRAMSCHHLEAD